MITVDYIMVFFLFFFQIYLFVVFIPDVHIVDFNNAVARFESSIFSWRSSVHFANKLTRFHFTGEQVKTESFEIRSFDYMAKTRGWRVWRNLIHRRLL